MYKIVFSTFIISMLAACSAGNSATEATSEVADSSIEAIQRDIAANAIDPVTDSGKTVNLEALKAAFDAIDCSQDRPVQNASCRVGDKPGEFNCNYALKGDNVFSVKETVIAEDGEGWKFIEVPNHCTVQ